MKSIVCSVAIALACHAASAQVLFFDNFDDGPDPAWGNELGNWVAPTGEYYATNPANLPPTYSLLPFVVEDMDLVVDVREIQDGGIWIHCDDTRNNGVLLVMGGNNHTYPGFYWHTITAGSYSAALELSGTVFTLGTDHELRVRVRGDTYQVFVDGNPAAASTLVTADFPSGKAGFYDNTATQLRFDNVLLSIPCGGDYNDSGEADILDFLDFFDDFGICDQQPAPCGSYGNPDLNGDTVIDVLDFLGFLDAFGQGC